MDDINVHVSQRAILQLGTIHDSAVKVLVTSLEYQFDTVAVDRLILMTQRLDPIRRPH